MALRTGLSGLNTAATDLNVIGNNVANASTIGFKKSDAHFADSYAAAIANTAPTSGQIGIGTQVARIAQLFTQGTIQVTNNPLDVAINGGGFFRLTDNGSVMYSRNGQFNVDKDGYIVNDSGARLSGYQAVNGKINGALGDLKITQSDIAPTATQNVATSMNLPAAATAMNPALFKASDPSTYNSSTSTTVYDSLGTSHIVSLYMIKDSTSTSSPPAWQVMYQIDGGNAGVSPNTGNLMTLNFDSNGAVTGTSAANLGPVTWGNGAANSTLNFNFAGSTLFDSPFSVNTLTVDGNTSGRLTGLNVAPDGNIFVRYSNGQSQVVGQVALSNFNNPDGLQATGKNMWVETYTSGKPLTGAPGSANLGQLQSGAVESSNVDLTEELVNMITAQRTYQANAQTIKTEDQLLQTLLTLR